MLILQKVEAMSKEIANYWLEEKKHYYELSLLDPSDIKQKITVEEIQKKVENLSKQKEIMEVYHKSMIIVNSSCNFTTNCQPSPLPTEIKLLSLQLYWK